MDISQLTINAIKTLSVDQVEKANSGHPGLPLGAATFAYTLWHDHMNHNPRNPNWMNRDRFILSAGHGSALLYSLLHIFDYGLSIEDLKNFRQLGSKTPGHPEYGYTQGVEATTGPLGQGLAMGVGMALAEAHLGERFNTEEFKIIDHYTYILAGDGCLMEGITNEASSLAGHLGLSKLIVLYDSNSITIDGTTDLAFGEDVRARYEALGWDTYLVEDGEDRESVSRAIEKAKESDKPSLIEIKTIIGRDSPLAGSEKSHGAPLGVDNTKVLRENLAYAWGDFEVPEEVYSHMETFLREAGEKENQWNESFERYQKHYPEKFEELQGFFEGKLPEDYLDSDEFFEFDGDMATRKASGQVINKLKDRVPNLIGGSADLAGSNNTTMDQEAFIEKNFYSPRNIHFGVREHAMAAIANGLALYGGTVPYVATFLVFSDYMKPAIRLSALMGTKLIYVFTHDSIGVGEDGPTHQPISHQAMLRAVPGLVNFRPGSPAEVAAAWKYALKHDGPTALSLTRQDVSKLEGKGKEAERGAYVFKEWGDGKDLTIIATGSELGPSFEAGELLSQEGINVRLVSMPSQEVFEGQDDSYKEEVLPSSDEKRLVVEAGSSFGWHKYSKNGDIVSVDSFGESAKGSDLMEKFGFTPENIAERAKKLINS